MLSNEISVGGLVSVESNSKIQSLAGSTTLKTLHDLRFVVVGTVLVDATSEISAAGAGYQGNYQGGPDYTYNVRPGCHAGWRGGPTAGCSYGRYELANSAGSAWIQSSGGGIVRIKSSKLTLNGVLSADAKETSSFQHGGAGGSVYLDVTEFAGSGSVTANGGDAGTISSRGAGGGGRISIAVAGARTFDGEIQARGGAVGTIAGAGTVFIKDGAEAHGELIADNSARIAVPGSTRIRQVGRHKIVSVNEVEPDIWEVNVEGTPWPATDALLGWGVDGIQVDLDASEDAGPTYLIESNTTNTLIVRTADDFSGLVGNDLVGVHTFKAIKLSGGASVDFGDDKLFIEDLASSYIRSGAKLKAATSSQDLMRLALVGDGVFETTAELTYTDLDFSNFTQGKLIAPSLTVTGALSFNDSTFNIDLAGGVHAGSIVSANSTVNINHLDPLVVDGALSLTSSAMQIESAGVHIGTNLDLSESTLSLKMLSNEISVGGLVSVESNSKIQSLAGSTTLKTLHDLRFVVVGTVLVDATSEISAAGAGYQGNYQGGPDYTYNVRPGCHAGWRGGPTAGCSYGRYELANSAGSAWIQSSGGGIVRIKSSKLTLNGVLSADAKETSSFQHGGAGGSVYLDVTEFAGSGSVTANGGDAGTISSRGAGGGGRISIAVAGARTFDGEIQARGGAVGTIAGAGTVFIKDGADSHGSLVIDNGGRIAVAGSTRIRQVGEHTIVAATSTQSGVWLIEVEGTPWEPTDVALGWGIDGIEVDLDATEESSSLYRIVSNTQNEITINTTDDLSGVVGRSLVGVHTFDSIRLSGGAKVSFGIDKIRLNRVVSSYIRSDASLQVNSVNAELVSFIIDTDGDGIPDVWETLNGLDPNDPSDAVLDRDGDGTSNLDEYLLVGYTFNGDGDSDGMADAWEIRFGLNPGLADQNFDKDLDGLTNIEEFQADTNPIWHDTDNDYSPDGEEFALNRNPLIKDLGLDLSANADTQCAIRDDQLYCWGLDADIIAVANHPTLVNPTMVNVGSSSACVVDEGNVKCWGSSSRILDNVGAANDSLGKIIDVQVGAHRACALDIDGDVFCWGYNFNIAANAVAPDFSQEVTQLTSSDNHDCALLQDGTPQCWGDNRNGETNIPSDLGKVSYIAAGDKMTCAVSDGQLHCWGSNNFFRIGRIPSDLVNVTHVDISSRHVCAVSNSQPVCWGYDSSRVLNSPELSGVRRLALGTNYSCALSDQGVTCWSDVLESRPAVPAALQEALDVDQDGIDDDWERANGLNPRDPSDAALDSDADGQTNLEEFIAGTGPQDRDNDGLTDAEEVMLGTDPALADSDSDNMPDGYEVRYGLNPLVDDQLVDKDQDSLTNLEEYQANTNPLWHDTDNDLSSDAEELVLGSNPLVKDFPYDLSGYSESECALRDNKLYCWGTDSEVVDEANHPALSLPTKVSVGYRSACVVDEGEVKCWGLNHTNFITHVDIANENLGTVVDVGVGDNRACALDSEGTVFCWGKDNGGATTTTPSIDDAVHLSVGDSHSCVIKEDLSAQCWGNNQYGQSTIPSDLGKISHILAGYRATCAIADGGMQCWGQDYYSSINGIPTDLSNVTQVAMGAAHTCAVSDAGPMCWGNTSYGKLNIPSLSNIRKIANGESHSCALSDEGVTCWGYDANSYVKTPAEISQSIDVDKDGMGDDWERENGLNPHDASDASQDPDADGQSNLEEFIAGTGPHDRDNDGLTDAEELAIGTDSTLVDSDNDGLPDGYEVLYELNPLFDDSAADKDQDTLTNLEEYLANTNPLWHDSDNDLSPDAEELALSSDPLVKDFALDLSGYGDNITAQCALRDKQLYCWGSSDDVVDSANHPTLISPTKVSVGYRTSACAVDQGEVKCWGQDSYNFIKDSASANQRLGTIVDVGVGSYRGCALDSEGSVFCWGNNSNGATTKTPLIDDAIEMSVGNSHSCVIKQDLSAQCWGNNTNGQASVPIDLGKVRHIEAGYFATCAITASDGGLRCWGKDYGGNVNDAPQDLTNVTQIEIGTEHSCAVSDAGPVCWGNNTNGELNVSAFSGVRKFSIGANYTCALTSQDVRCVGDYSAIPDELKDRTKPFDVRNLIAETLSDTSAKLSWELPSFNADDIDTYEITVTGQATIEVASGNLSAIIDTLSAGTVYDVSVVTRDAAGNKSEGVSTNVATAYANPSALSGVGRSNLVDLSWVNPSETSGISAYRIYQSESAFTNITGMQAVLEVQKNNTASSIGGLTNDTAYYFAITSVNISGFETKAVTSLQITPESDSTAPVVSNATFGANPVVTGFTAANDDAFCVEVIDISKISRVEFSVDGNFADSDSTADNGYCFNLRVSELDDASHQISVAAYDVFENVEPINYTISIQLAPPSIPLITKPTNGLVTNQQTLDVEGTSMPGLEVQATVNTIEGEWSTINATGQFSIAVFLSEQGDNTIIVRARNRSGEGAYSAPIVVELDTTLPAKPIGVNAEVKDSGVVSLGWSTGTGGRIESFEIYRSDSDVFDIPNTGKINSNTVTSTSFSDLVVDDGTYYYKVVSLNEFGVRSEASLSTSATVDVTDPFAETIEYSTDGDYDAASDTYGRGNLSITLSVNEPLLTTPFLSISPDGGVPISVALSQSDESDTVYNGRIILNELVRSGTAYAVFSARDKAGNRGTNVNSGQQINIDTAGPIVVGVTSDPASPIKNDSASPVTLTVAFNLDESLSASVAPTLKYSLSSSATDPQEANSVVKLADKSWQASITLPSNAGADQAETLSLLFEGEDNLANRTENANPISTIQVYQGDLPALEAPFNFRGNAISGGRVALEWFEVQQASAYKLYRKSETDADFTLLVELTTGESYTDQTPIDGDYQYQLSSVRSDNGELAESARTAPLSVTTDSVSPAKPEGLTLELFPIGIQAEWLAVSEADISYQLYTAESGPITDVSSLAAILEGLNQPFVVDTNASQSKPAYAVVAVDSIGNKSEPSETAYLNVDLLPVASIKVRLLDGQVPTLNWTHSKPSIDSFDVFFGQQGQTVKINDATISGNQYIDVGYSNESKTYSVVAIDVNDERSLPRFISLPKVELEIAQGQQIKRNLINVIDVTVANLSDQPISNARINLLSEQANFKSAQVDIAANAEITVPITVGGLESLPDLWQPSLELHSQPNAGESIEIAKTISMDVRDGALALSFETEDFIRGADGTLRLSIENSGDQAIQLITATNQGKSDSPDVLLSLRDEDDNVLSVVGMRQALGEGVVNNVAGEAILTLAAGERWQSEPITVSVPLNAPETVFLSAVIRNMYANRGTPEQVTVKGPSSRQQIVLTETPYRGEITSITPDNSFGREPIVIKGQALDRETDRLLSNVDLQIIISLNGFERSFEVLTDSAGEFELSYQSQDGESGVYKVSVLHPIQTSRPNSGEFVISRLTVSPSVLNLRIPYDLAYNIPISFRAGEGTELNNLSFAVEAVQQANGQLPQGIEFTYPSIAKLTSLQRITENITITADNTADENGEFVVSIYADESPDTVIGTIEVGYAFSEAKPSLAFTPSILELGSTLDTVASGSITLENKGLASLKDVRVTLKTADGFPASDWIKLTTQNSLGDIAVGESAKADILLQPNNVAPTGVERLVLEVKSANAPTYQVPIVTSIVESGEGGILIKVTDMYSGTLNSVGQIIQGLENANVRIQNESDPSIEFVRKADDIGEVLVEGIPSGRYSVWVSAPNYREVHQRIRVQPDFIATEQIFLDYELIKLEWTVNEITLEDRYEITLRATFETDVPAAVVMIEPTNIKLPPMEQGDVFYGELIMTNYGLIRAFDINFVPQQSDEFYQFEYLTSVVPESLEAKEQVVVPYKVTALRSLEQQDATGGGCGVYTKCASVACKSNCPTGVSVTDSSSCVSVSYGSCGGGQGFIPPYRPTYGDGGPIYNPGGGGGGANDPLPQGGGFPRCRAAGGNCGKQRGGGAK